MNIFYGLLCADYYNQAILHSGSELAVWAVNTDDVNPHGWIHDVAAVHSCDLGDNASMMDCLRDVGPWLLQNTKFNCTVSLSILVLVWITCGKPKYFHG